MRIALLTVLGIVVLGAPLIAQEGSGPAAPAGARKVMPASDEAEASIKGFTVPPGFKVGLFAAEPHVANISSFDIAPDGRAYVVEVFRRRGGGVLDMRNLPAWLEEDLATRTVADRIAMVKRRLTPAEQRAMELEADRVRLVEDRDGDGRADHASVFADGFNKLEDGTAAGVLAFGGNVYFANIPSLWLLRDQDDDGRAEVRKALHTGFGVRYNISGHDLHGLRVGPDGRLYFSIGDRGLRVVRPDGAVVSNPDSGAVLRCELDGSNLELVHTGLRNPQDLAFDDYGNLFTCDNNSDGGDASRWVYVVEGGDSGWRTGYQWHDYPVRRGPWNNERLWDAKSEIPAAYILPPLANPDVAGPSGMTFTGGVGLPPEWQDRFLVVDFRGGATNSGVWALQNKPKGASFELVEAKKLVWGTLATDVELGYDGGVYFSDWVSGWVPTGRGRIYRISHGESSADPAVRQVTDLVRRGLESRNTDDPAGLLGHADSRVRSAAQFQLAARTDLASLAAVARGDGRQLARVHAVWGIGQLARTRGRGADVLIELLGDRDEEVRAQAAKVLADARGEPAEAVDALRPLLNDPSNRVAFFAAMAFGKLSGPDDDPVPPLLDVLRRNKDRDAYLRHAVVVALARPGNLAALKVAAKEADRAVRLGVLLAMRRLHSEAVAGFLKDPSPELVLEAARAINDTPIRNQGNALAALAEWPMAGEGKVRELIVLRAVNARYYLGGDATAAGQLAAYARRNDLPDFIRVEAIDMLAAPRPTTQRDRATGLYVGAHGGVAPEVAAGALRPVLPELLRGAPDKVRLAAASAVAKVGITDTAVLLDVITDAKFSPEARAAALEALAAQKGPQLAAAVGAALKEKNPAVRRAAIGAMPHLPDGPSRLRRILESGSGREQQAAFEALARLPAAPRQTLLLEALDRLVAGKVPPEARLDLITAAERAGPSGAVADKLRQYRTSRPGNDPLGDFRDTLAGGDAARGRRIFNERADVQCLRCHSIKGEGGNAGPDLAGIGKKQTREYLLESILFPAKHIAQGWETVTVRVKSGDTFAGVMKSEDARQIVLLDPEKGKLRIEKSEVTGRRGGQSAMPSDIAQPLTKHDLRDLVEFLAGLK